MGTDKVEVDDRGVATPDWMAMVPSDGRSERSRIFNHSRLQSVLVTMSRSNTIDCAT